MKGICALLALLVTLTAGAAFAVTVDFGALGPPAYDPPLTVDIISPNALTLDGVTFTYDSFGSTDPFDFASADPGGIFGSTYGALNLSFAQQVRTLSLDFSVFGVGGPDPNALVAAFGNGDGITLAGLFQPYDPADPSFGDIVGRLSFESLAPFDTVSLLFSPVVDPALFPDGTYIPYFFSVSNVAYNEPVPEPGTFFLLAAGIAAVAGVRLLRRRA